MSAVAAFAMANFMGESIAHAYEELLHTVLFALPEAMGGREVTVHFFAASLMAIFFYVVTAEFRASLLSGGALDSLSKAAVPIVGCIGGVVVPVAFQMIGSAQFAPDQSAGWAIPSATDIAFALAVATALMFSPKHPAVAFLLTLALVDDIIGMIILLGWFRGEANVLMIVGTFVATALVTLTMRTLGFTRPVWYFIPAFGGLIGFLAAGVEEPVLSMVGVALCLPHSQYDSGMFASRDFSQRDTLNRTERLLKPYVHAITVAFAFVSAGVVWQGLTADTVLYLVALIGGKLAGISAFTFIAVALGLSLPLGMRKADVFRIAAAGGIGFTVALLVTGIVFGGSDLANGPATAALLSVPLGAGVTFLVHLVLPKPYSMSDIERMRVGEEALSHA